MRYIRFPTWVALFVLIGAPASARPPVPFADAGLHAVRFVDEHEGWAVGDDGAVWHSIDGGRTWERQKSGTRASLRGVHFLTPYTGWAVGRVERPGGGSVGVLLKTTDGGLHWQEIGLNVLPGLNGVHFFNEKEGLVWGDGGGMFGPGLFTTSDGGRTWKPATGAPLPSCRAVAIFPGTRAGVVAGAWSHLGTLTDGTYQEADYDPLDGRSLHAVAVSTGGRTAYAVGDGGAVLRSSDGGRSWGFVDLGLPPAALAACDFRAVACRGDHIWVAGRPGGFVLHSADGGQTWDVQKTELTVPVNGLFFLTDRVGWMTAELGVIYGTTDGGRTWTVHKAGGQRAAVLFLHASARSAPLEVVSALGHAEGYVCAGVTLTGADPATAAPHHAAAADRFRQAMRWAGGAAGEVGWAFPLPGHAAGLSPRDLLAVWDRRHGNQATEHLLRQAVLAIRIWQPDVVVTDLLVEGGPPADVLALHAAKEAFRRAADPDAFPEHGRLLGLKPWAARKLYALAPDGKDSPVKFDATAYHATLADTPRDFAEPALRLLTDAVLPAADRRCFTLVAHRLEGAETYADLMQGITLARGGAARRPETPAPFDPETAEARRHAAQARRRLEALAAAANDPELAGVDKLLGTLDAELAKLPDDVAARTAFVLAHRLVHDGRWAEAREVFGLLTTRHPGHPLALDAFRWLAAYHAGSEPRRRAEIYQKLQLRTVTFETVPGVAGSITAAAGRPASATTPAVHIDEYRFFSPDAVVRWHQACLDLEPKIAAFGPAHAHDPAAWLAFLTARRQVGRHTDALTFVRDYFQAVPGAATLPPGQDPWRDCLAAELWLTDGPVIPTPPKPLAHARYTETRPLLDGKLDDACWQDTKPVVLTAADGSASGLADAFATEARFAYDDRFLYLAVTCRRPAGRAAEPVAHRTRDADLTGQDRVDILLDLDRDYQTYYRFRIDHRGRLAEDCWGDPTWNPKYFVAFHATETGWTAEWAVPLVELTGDRPGHGRTWAMNVVRVVPGQGLLSWSRPADDPPRPEGLGLLQFRAGQ